MPQNITDLDRQGVIGSGDELATPAIHFTLQGKGGVGKSLVASILAQYFRHRGAEIHCIDTDPALELHRRKQRTGTAPRHRPPVVRSHGGDGRTGARGHAQGFQESG